MSNDTVICHKCKKKNLQDANFCCRCGINLIKSLKKCSICLEEKTLEILICGHLICRKCTYEFRSKPKYHFLDFDYLKAD